jgi:DNA topoisomerase-3
MKLVIAEKPSVGREIAKILGAETVRSGYLEGNGYLVTWAFGHLVQLAGPEEYGFTSWSKSNLPILPEQFSLSVKQVKGKSGYSADEGAEKQIKLIGQLLDRVERIVVATDAGREGELIFRFIYEYLGCRKPFVRLWISSLTEKAIRDGFNALKPGKDFDPLYQSARCRAEADWLVGINATQALTLSCGNKGLLSLGRVQTPTLAMICERYLANTGFKAVPYYLVKIGLEKGIPFGAIAIKGGKVHHFNDLTQAQALEGRVRGKVVKVKEAVKEDQQEQPPLLYDLGSLQQDANKRYGLSTEETLRIAQDLYEKKLITYPRTGSRYIGEDVFETVPGLIRNAMCYEPFAKAAAELIKKKLNKRSVNDGKVTDHHALLPTENKPGKLSADEKTVYDLVVGRMLESFGESCKKTVTTVVFEAKVEPKVEYEFQSRGVQIVYPGWRSVWGVKEEEDSEENQSIPALIAGEELPVKEIFTEAKKTKPQPLFTEGTLLKAMETAGKEIDDEELRAAMKDCGLGTPATRAAVIGKLFSIGYIDRQKKSIVPTPKGLEVYNLVKEKNISKPVLTGEWEKKLEDIRGEIYSAGRFMNEICEYTSVLTKEILEESGSISVAAMQPGATRIACPKCKKGVITIREKAAGCSEYKSGCDFTIWRTIASKKLTDTQIQALIQKGKTGTVKGFMSSKTNKPFDAVLTLGSDYKVSFVFDKK